MRPGAIRPLRPPETRRDRSRPAPEIVPVGGTIAAALGLGLRLWLAGLLLWVVGHSIAVFAAKRDPDFAEVLRRHLRHKAYLAC